MFEEEVKKYVGKKVQIILKGNFLYNANITKVENNTCQFIDKFKNQVSVNCEKIDVIILMKEDYNGS